MIFNRRVLILLSGLAFNLCLASEGPAIVGTETVERNFELNSYARDLGALQEALGIAGFSKNIPDEYSDPTHGPLDFMLNARQAPWAGNYFPMFKGGLANRWQTREKIDIEKLRDIKKSLRQLTPDQINRLSPIEKYDLYRGDYTFKSTLHELHKRGPLRPLPVEEWEGFCNGVRCAGIHLPEPKHPITVASRDGIPVTFQPADLKALAGASYFFVEKYSQMGGPSFNDGHAQNQPNAAVFDLALRYYVAAKKAAFVIDSHLGSEIWNETVIGYKRDLLEPEPLTAEDEQLFPGAVSKRRVRLDLYSLADVSIRESNQSTKAKVAAGDYHKTTKTEYTLFLDSSGRAINGLWKKTRGLRGIDFVWFSGGRGTDSKNPQGNGNELLSFRTISRLVKLSSQALSCRQVLLNIDDKKVGLK